MFGKKSGSGGKAKSRSNAKQGQSAGFFASHIEKLVMGLVCGLLAFMVWNGLQTKGYDPKKTPEELTKNATTIANSIRDNDPWSGEDKLESLRKVSHDYKKQTEISRLRTDASVYAIGNLKIPDGFAYKKRADPTLLPPIKLIGQSVVGLVAVEGPEKAIDPIDDLEDAPKLKKAGGGRKNQRDPNMAGMEGGPGTMGSPGSGIGSGMPGGEGMMGSPTQKRLLTPTYNRGFSLLPVGGMGAGGIGGYGDSPIGGDTGMMGSGGGTIGAPGMPGGVPPGGRQGLGGVTRITPRKTLSQFVMFNAVTALVPHEEMYNSFKTTFEESFGYNPMRDRPVYLSFEVERVDVTADPNRKIDDSEWKPIANNTDVKQRAMMKDWMPKRNGMPKTPMDQIPDIIDPTASEIGLTMPIPPILLRDYRYFAKHPDIDWRWDITQNITMPTPDPNKAKEGEKELAPGELAGSMPSAGGMGVPGMAGDGGFGSGMAGSEGGFGSGMGGAVGGGYGGDMGMMGSDGGFGGGYGGGYGSGMGMMYAPPKYKMIRFYDKLSENEVGRVYKYRVRVMMEDPNYPDDWKYPTPAPRDLEDSVFDRVSKLRAKDQPTIDANRKKDPMYKGFRQKQFTPWSDGSNPVFVRGTEDVYVGEFTSKPGADRDQTVKLAPTKVDSRRNLILAWTEFKTETKESGKENKDQPEVKDSSSIPQKAKEFRRGAILNNQAKFETQIIHPVSTVIKTLKDVTFPGSATIVDMRGNNPLANSTKDDTLNDAGEVLMLMGDGRVEISSDLDDMFNYREFTFAEEIEILEKGGAGAAGGFGGGMGPGGIPGGSSGS